MRATYFLPLTVLIGLLRCASVQGQEISVAVAANARVIVQKIAASFTKNTGVKIIITPGSSGKLAAQIRQGASFDVFLSADTTTPMTLWKDGFAQTRPVPYTKGRLLLCSRQPVTVSNWRSQLIKASAHGGHIAIANPDLAPYGKAAKECLMFYHLYDQIKSSLVFGESITQVHLFLVTGSVDIGFASATIFSDPGLHMKLYSFEPSTRSYTSIIQGMIILKNASGKRLAAASDFCRFLLAREAQEIFVQAGYLTL